MKVAELIGKLLAMPMNAEVVVLGDQGCEHEPDPVFNESETEPKVQL